MSRELFSQQIHLIYTSAVIQKDYELRRNEYLNNLQALRSYGFEPWIIEATNIQSSFFDAVSNRVFYPQKHNSALRNKGVNETMSIRAVLSQLPFEDDDIVIKMTGRYLLKSRHFIEIIETTANDYDAWGVFGKHFTKKNDLFTGCYAMRWKYLKEIIQEMDLDAAERDYIAVEILFGKFLQNNPCIRVNKLKNLHVQTRVFICGPGDDYFEF